MSVTYGGDKFVAVAEEEIAYSVDGVNWVLKDSPISGQLTCVTYGDGKFVATIDNSAYAIYSTNGVTWEISRITPDSIHQSWRSVTYGKGKFVAIADSSDIIAYSRDGINWYYGTVPVFQYPNGTDVGEQVKVALQIVEPDVPQPSNKNPLASGATASAGISTEYARGDHVHPRDWPKATKITLAADGWSSSTMKQSVTVSGVSDDATSQEISVMPVNAAIDSPYIAAGVQCVAQAENRLTIACETVPLYAIEVYVVMQSVDYSA